MSERMRDAIERGNLAQAAEWEAAACDRDGFEVTARLLRALTAELAETQRALAKADDLLRRLSEWDMLYVPRKGSAATADAPYWQGEIAKARAALAAAEPASVPAEREGER